jgi:hypothetical protein
MTPVVTSAVYSVPPARAADGVKVTTAPLTEYVPVTAEPPCGVSVNVDEVIDEALIASLKVAVTVVLVAILIAVLRGVTAVMVGGGGGAAAVVKLQL